MCREAVSQPPLSRAQGSERTWIQPGAAVRCGAGDDAVREGCRAQRRRGQAAPHLCDPDGGSLEDGAVPVHISVRPPVVRVVDARQLQVGVLLCRGDCSRPLGQVEGGPFQPARRFPHTCVCRQNRQSGDSDAGIPSPNMTKEGWNASRLRMLMTGHGLRGDWSVETFLCCTGQGMEQGCTGLGDVRKGQRT